MTIAPVSRYPGQTTTASAAYPSGGAQNVTSPGAGDGTPFDEAWLNEWFGLQQGLLARSGQTANNVVDTATSNQVISALDAMFAPSSLPIGTLSAGVISATVPMGGLTTLSAGMMVRLYIPSVASFPTQVSLTLRITPTGGSPLTPVFIVDSKGNSIVEADLDAPGWYNFVFDGTNFINNQIAEHKYLRGIRFVNTDSDLSRRSDKVVFLDVDSGSSLFSFILASADCVEGREIIILKDQFASSGDLSISIDTEGSETIDGRSGYLLVGAAPPSSGTDGDQVYARLLSDGSNWRVLGESDSIVHV